MATTAPLPAHTLLEPLEALFTGLMAERGVPGFALALTDAKRTLLCRAYGYADLAARTPLTPLHLFQIGSVSKSSVALLVLQEVERGRLELHAPISTYLPFVETPGDAPITLHHLLTHSAGISRGLDAYPFTSYYEVTQLGRSLPEPPGERYRYSNLGYVALGWALERVTGIPLPELRAERVLGPLGMTGSSARISHRERERFPTAYVEFYGDRPHHPSYGLTPAPFYTFVHGDGSVCATPGDLARYARLFLNGGVGESGPLLSPESFRRMTTPYLSTDGGHVQGYGLELFELGGSSCLGHNGETHGFTTELLVDLDEGLGLALFCTCTGALNLTEVVKHLMRLLQAASRGEALPEPPAFDLSFVQNADDYAGLYHGALPLEFRSRGEQLFLLLPGEELRLERLIEGGSADRFFTLHPRFNRSAFTFLRNAAGEVSEVVHGGTWGYNARHMGATSFSVPEAWRAYEGEYNSFSPWSPGFRVHGVKGGLWLEAYSPSSLGVTPLEGLPDGTFRLVGQPETLAFDTLIDGRALRATLSGHAPFYRSELRDAP